jgi:hypothetical protein
MDIITKVMEYKMHKNIIITLTAILMLSGCMATQPNVKLDKNITSFKEYINQKRADDVQHYNIIAELPHQSIIEYRTTNEQTTMRNASDVLEILDDAKEYCQAIGGNGIYGDQAIKTINQLPTAFSFAYQGYKNDMRSQGFGKYSGFYRCASAKDGFEIEYMKSNIGLRQRHIIGGGYMQTYSRHYLITHKSLQKIGQKTWLHSPKYRSYAEGKSPKEYFDVDEKSQATWRYEVNTGAQKYCTYNDGELYISNAVTKNKLMLIDDYYFTRLEQIKNKSSINIFMTPEYLVCENSVKPQFAFVIEHPKQNTKYPQYTLTEGVDKDYLKAKGVVYEKIGAGTIPSKPSSQVQEISKSSVVSQAKKKGATLVKNESRLAAQTLSSKLDTSVAMGELKYTTSYNGTLKDGCEYASVTKELYGQKYIENFKKCSRGDVEYIGRTSPNELTDEVEDQLTSVAETLIVNCKLNNQASANINEFTLKCVKNPYDNAYKILLLKDGMLLENIQ